MTRDAVLAEPAMQVTEATTLGGVLPDGTAHSTLGALSERRELNGHGRSFASFGEIVQGRLSNGEDFLVTLPIDLWSSCTVVCQRHAGPSSVTGGLEKSRRVVELLLDAMGQDRGALVAIELQRNIPVGKGLSSSTADMLAVVRAVQDAFGLTISEDFVSRLFASIEPHDGLHFPMCVAYNHRAGRLLRKLDHVPHYHIVAVDNGGEVCTRAYNQRLVFSVDDLGAYDQLFDELTDAFSHRDDRLIAACADRSTRLHAERTGNTFLAGLADRGRSLGALGVLATHSGTCGGCLMPADASDSDLARLRAELAPFGQVFETKTLPMLA